MLEYCPFCGRKLKLWERNLDYLFTFNGCLKCSAYSHEFMEKLNKAIHKL